MLLQHFLSVLKKFKELPRSGIFEGIRGQSNAFLFSTTYLSYCFVKPCDFLARSSLSKCDKEDLLSLWNCYLSYSLVTHISCLEEKMNNYFLLTFSVTHNLQIFFFLFPLSSLFQPEESLFSHCYLQNIEK